MSEVLGGVELKASEGGRVLELGEPGRPIVTFTLALPGEPVAGWSPDDAELSLLTHEGVTLRVTGERSDAAWRLSLTADNARAEAVSLPYLGLGVTLGAGVRGWVWTSEAEAVLAFVAVSGRVLTWTMRRGFLRPVPALPLFPDEVDAPSLDAAGQAAFHLCPPSGALGAFRRHQVVFELREVPDLTSVLSALPAWLPVTAARAGTPVLFDLPDAAVVAGGGVRCRAEGTATAAEGPPGQHDVQIFGPGGNHRVPISWWPAVEDFLPVASEALLARRPDRASAAAGLVVAEALARELAPEPERAADWLERVDWLDRDSLLADATAGVLAAHLGERRQLDQVWRLLGSRKVEPGYGLVVMRVWLATLAATGEPPAVAHELLMRPAPDATSALELALLSYRGQDVLTDGVRDLVAALGGPLPGRPSGLTASDAARAVSLLRLCPEAWAIRQEASAAMEKAGGTLFADYVAADGGLAGRPLDGLAWLLLGELGI